MRNLNKILLLFFPFIYLILGFYFNQLIGYFSLRNVDPEYVYLTNGLYMSLGHLNIYHIDNPGTPLQFIVAVVCRIVYFFRSHDVPYIEDVFRNSDMYLNMINHVVITITAIVIYISGRLVLKLTSFLPYALAIQTAPFYSDLTYGIIGRLTPELLICIPVFFLTIILIKTIIPDKKRFTLKTILLFSIISGFGLSIKLTYMPLLIVPLFVIPGFKDKGRFLLFTIISLFVFAMPIIFDLVSFTGWIKDLFIHSGQYGRGDTSIINLHVFSHNLGRLINTNMFMVISWIVSLSILIFYIFFKRKSLNKSLLFGLSGVLLAFLFQVLLVSKHYEFRYLAPALALFPGMVILSLEMIKRLVSFKRINLIIGLIILGGFIYLIPKHVTNIRIASTRISTQISEKIKAKHFVETLEDDAVKLITPGPYGCPYHDFSIMISHCWAGWENKVFLPVYKKLYPDTYQYFTWEKRAKYWEYPYDINRIVQNEKPVYFYIANYSPELYTKSLSAMIPGYDLDNINEELVFINEGTKERIYRLTFEDL